jgi:glycyl-radical enzyme activating protein
VADPGTGGRTGVVFDIERFSMHDGPGIRTVVFLKGCPLRCTWCHNPESWLGERQLHFDPRRCIGCGECFRVCPTGAHATVDGRHVVLRDRCRACLRCTEACAAEALEAVGKLMTVAEVLDEVARDRTFYATSGGGLTASGGEPFSQPAFLLALLDAARRERIGTCVETSGWAEVRALRDSLPLVDRYLFDCKETDPERHVAGTGHPLAPVLESLRILDEGGARVVLRCPLVPGHNLRDDHLVAVAALSRSLRGCEGVEVLGYHPLGGAKRAYLGMDAGAAPTTLPATMRRDQIDAAVRRLVELGATNPSAG